VLQRLLGAEHPAGQRDLVGEAAARPEPGGDPVLGTAEAALDFPDLKLRVFRGDDQVARL
jgi:hypothetical protein